ncbi:hypothetical protein [Mesorhizobium sp. GbtcB19]|uniref:hypothetical protein n=1 Tax=Mesorhizobium sp. GbtcB19 TaxID=2824764 RepID=UPI001C307E96|nr:hypothetical protein [Mesorhizobium sp. GbtcB19]
MTFADKCKLLGKRRGQKSASATADNKLRSALLPQRRSLPSGTAQTRTLALSVHADVPAGKP